MTKQLNLAASVKARLLNIAKEQQQPFDVVLIRYAQERLIYRLGISTYAERYILKGGLLVSLWLEDAKRQTRDADFLGTGDASEEYLVKVFTEIMQIEADDALRFDTAKLTATAIREETEYGGIRLHTQALIENTRISITIDIGFGDALTAQADKIEYPTLLDMPAPAVRAYPVSSVIAEKFQAMVDLGVANSRMKDYYDLWALPKEIQIAHDDLDAAISATFKRRKTEIPTERIEGLSEAFYADAAKQRQWRAYADSIELENVSLEEVANSIWNFIAASCNRLNTDSKRHD